MMEDRSAGQRCGQRIRQMSTTYLLGIAGKFFNLRRSAESRDAFPNRLVSVGLAKI
jgi:hypothetical protein